MYHKKNAQIVLNKEDGWYLKEAMFVLDDNSTIDEVGLSMDIEYYYGVPPKIVIRVIPPRKYISTESPRNIDGVSFKYKDSSDGWANFPNLVKYKEGTTTHYNAHNNPYQTKLITYIGFEVY